jgi:hypothetical protein
MSAKPDLKVFISSRESICEECGHALDPSAWICLLGERGALCLSCADLDHLVFLPAGDAALTRRACKHSTLSAVVLKWSRARKRYERQGLLVDELGLTAAESESLADVVARERRAERGAQRRAELDQAYVGGFARRVRELFPACPSGREFAIAEHACLKYTGRVGRTAAAKTFDADVVHLAVLAHVRHVETLYDELLASGLGRHEARRQVEDQVRFTLGSWQRD